MFSHLRSCQRPRFRQQRKRFGSPLHGARLDTARAVANALLDNQQKEALEFVVAIGAGVMIPTDPDLQGVFEAQRSR